MVYVGKFNYRVKYDLDIAGGKGSSLSEMTQMGILVPEGFVLFCTAFELFLKETGIAGDIDKILRALNYQDINAIEEASKKIQELIFSGDIPWDVKNELHVSFKELDSKYVAIRSSATVEDGTNHTWAGQLESYLNTTENSLFLNIKKCWASLFASKAMLYRFEKGLLDTHVSVAVVIQKMINSEKSGIAFSIHPVTGDHNQVVIEAGYGLGEAIVSGQVTPDLYIVEKESRKIVNIQVSEQKNELIRNRAGGNMWRGILPSETNKQKLSEDEILELFEIVMSIEKHHGFFCDTEWAYERGRFYITQCRPVTTSVSGRKNEFGATGELLNTVNSVNSGDWINFINRPFSLFVVSLWHYCYKEYIPLITQGRLSIPDGIFIQEKNGVVRNYRKEKSIQQAKDILYDIYKKNRGDLIALLQKAEEINSVAEAMLSESNNFKSLDDILDLICRTTVYGAVLPRFVAEMSVEHNLKDSEMVFKYENLKKKTFYPKLLTDIYIPRVANILSSVYPNTARLYVNFILLDELKSCNFDFVEERFLKEQQKEMFVYVADKNNVSLMWIEDTEDVLKLIDRDVNLSKNKIISGSVAFAGKVKGVARVCVTLDGSDLDDFKDGDILVSINSSPNLMSWINKASAIVTDEGGITCHAAIISRELKIPCIIGTGSATKMIKNGDCIMVNALSGEVHIL